MIEFLLHLWWLWLIVAIAIVGIFRYDRSTNENGADQ